jgi:hypothetical protein
MSKIRSFRGNLADGAIDTISLHTNNGSTGYRINKLQLFGQQPGTTDQESTVKIFSIPQSTATSDVDFSDNTLLAVGYVETDQAQTFSPGQSVVVFDNIKFNQDIYLTHVEDKAAVSCNYYIELEMVKLSLDENTVATLKDIRNITEPTL